MSTQEEGRRARKTSERRRRDIAEGEARDIPSTRKFVTPREL
jgi:hypothetical protein